MSYLVIAYPELVAADFNRIQSFRNSHDRLYFSLVEPHITFVFPVDGIDEDVFVSEIIRKANKVPSFFFELKCATVNKDAFKEIYHTFLVPDEGYGKIVRLHDQLYSDKLQKYHRFDIDFIPHLGVGNSEDPKSCKKMADEWNSTDFSIRGMINMLSVINFSDGRIRPVAEVRLGEME